MKESRGYDEASRSVHQLQKRNVVRGEILEGSLPMGQMKQAIWKEGQEKQRRNFR
jgi:hypothetical protein